MKIAVPREVLQGETRVALVPESVKKLVSAGFEVAVEHGAGQNRTKRKHASHQSRATAKYPAERRVETGRHQVAVPCLPIVEGAVPSTLPALLPVAARV